MLEISTIPNLSDPSYVYYWDFGDGNTSTLVSPTHNFEEGTYAVKLRIRDPYGKCFLDETKICTIDYYPRVNIPNVFTPNQDGINDALVIEAEHLLSYELVIFDKWGKTVLIMKEFLINIGKE